MNHVQIDDRTTLPVAHLAADDSVVTDIARALGALFFLGQTVQFGSIDSPHAEPLAFPRSCRDEDAAFVRDVLAGVPDSEIYEREARDSGHPIVSFEEYDVLSGGGAAPTMANPPYEHMSARHRRVRELRRAFVLVVAGGIGEIDENCRLNGHHWIRSGVRRGTHEA